MRRKILCILCSCIFYAITVYAQTPIWKTADQTTVKWEVVTGLTDGSPIPAGDIVTYQLYTKKSDGSNIVKSGSPISALSGIVTFIAEGQYFYGVSAIRKTISGEIVESSISWSDNPANMKDGITKGVQYYLLLKQPILIN